MATRSVNGLLTSVDSLFTTQQERDEANLKKIYDIPISEIDDFPEHPYTPSGEAFDVGRTCLNAIISYFTKGTKATESGGTDEHSNGNGSLMRIHPFALYEFIKGTCKLEVIHNASSLTHAHERSKIACGIYSSRHRTQTSCV